MNKKVILYSLGGILVTAAILYTIKIKVSSANSDSLIARWLEKHPTSRDSSGAGKVPLLISLVSDFSLVTFKK